jgi:nicotinate phosphoribosyltransferase
MNGSATFSLFVRRLPPGRGYLLSAGLEDALDYLEAFQFRPDELSYLESTRLFTRQTLRRLEQTRFTGSVRAVAEGTPVFGEEPLIEVTASILEAQLVETVLINEIQLQTMIATKASRCVTAANGRRLLDFSLRRTQGLETGLKVARASYLAGFHATSNVEAGMRYGVPIAGTMAHSFIQAFPDETEAFRAYARAYPDDAVLLIDTYDTIEGAKRAAIVGRELAMRGHQLRGVRLDSGDLHQLSLEVRAILDAAGLSGTIIFASGGLDEREIARLVRTGSAIDGFGVGTAMGVSADAPSLDIAYKLVSYDGRPVLKLSTGKATWPGPKQVWRDQIATADQLALADEAAPAPGLEPLLTEVMDGGRRLRPPPALGEIRERSLRALARLPDHLRSLDAESRRVRPTDALASLRSQLEADRPPGSTSKVLDKCDT